MISFSCLSPSGSSPEFCISLSTVGEQTDKMYHVPGRWHGGQESGGFLAHYPMLLQLASKSSACALVGRQSRRICWTATGKWCLHLPQLCFQLKGQNYIIMPISERNCSERVQQCEAMKRLVIAAPPEHRLSPVFCSDVSAKEGISKDCD